MSLKLRLFLIAVLPLLLMAGALSWLGGLHANQLASDQIDIYRRNLLEAKKQELRNYLELANTAIAPRLAQADDDAQRALTGVRDLLNSMTFGEDGYFFLYDANGVCLVHPRQPELVGQNLFDLRDGAGHYVIRELLEASASPDDAQRFVQYSWNKPSIGAERRKLGYVQRLPRWNWMIGTGLYIDDIDRETARLQQAVSDNVRRNLMTTLIALALTTLLIFLLMLFVNLHDGRQSSRRLQELAHNFVRLQVQERRRFSRELHDGINQLIVAAKYRIQSVISRHKSAPAIVAPLEESLAALDEAIQEARRISHALRPGLLDDLGFEQAVASLLEQFRERTGVPVDWRRPPAAPDLPDDVEIMLYRVIQEALLNIEKHAQASAVKLTLAATRQHISLTLTDNGVGFSVPPAGQTTASGIGLITMRERVELLGGQFELHSSPRGTRIHAVLPLDAALAPAISGAKPS